MYIDRNWWFSDKNHMTKNFTISTTTTTIQNARIIVVRWWNVDKKHTKQYSIRQKLSSIPAHHGLGVFERNVNGIKWNWNKQKERERRAIFAVVCIIRNKLGNYYWPSWVSQSSVAQSIVWVFLFNPSKKSIHFLLNVRSKRKCKVLEIWKSSAGSFLLDFRWKLKKNNSIDAKHRNRRSASASSSHAHERVFV